MASPCDGRPAQEVDEIPVFGANPLIEAQSSPDEYFALLMTVESLKGLAVACITLYCEFGLLQPAIGEDAAPWHLY